MIQSEQQRRAYLEAMGIDVWLPRDHVDTVDEAVADTEHDVQPTDVLDWPELRARVAACTRCALHEGRTQTVFGVGNPDADWMVIGEAHILNLCVDPSYRSHGYGERLLDEILFRARAASVREIFLEVRPSNQTALALYRKKGFHIISNRPAYYQAQAGREDAAVLVKKLVSDS